MNFKRMLGISLLWMPLMAHAYADDAPPRSHVMNPVEEQKAQDIHPTVKFHVVLFGNNHDNDGTIMLTESEFASCHGCSREISGDDDLTDPEVSYSFNITAAAQNDTATTLIVQGKVINPNVLENGTLARHEGKIFQTFAIQNTDSKIFDINVSGHHYFLDITSSPA